MTEGWRCDKVVTGEVFRTIEQIVIVPLRSQQGAEERYHGCVGDSVENATMALDENDEHRASASNRRHPSGGFALRRWRDRGSFIAVGIIAVLLPPARARSLPPTTKAMRRHRVTGSRGEAQTATVWRTVRHRRCIGTFRPT